MMIVGPALIVLGIVLIAAGIVSIRAVHENVPTETSPLKRCVPPAVSLGMSREQLIENCGKPSSINHQVLGKVDKEQYAYGKNDSYVYLTDGTVTSIQYAENGEKFNWKSN